MADGVLGAFTLPDEIERFSPGESGARRRAETLIKSDRLRVVLVTMRAGASLHEHTAPGPITIQALRGHFTVSVEDAQRDLPQGALVAIDASVRHAVTAREDGAFLLTIAWPPDVLSEPAATQAEA
jgi:quercetin dioxygenase-like cupin family protein